MNKLLQILKKKKIEYRLDADFSEISYLGLKQKLKALINPKNIKQLKLVLKILIKYNLKYAFISMGTNSYLIDDNVVLISLMSFKKIDRIRGNRIIVSANQRMSSLSFKYARRNIISFIGGTLIPGSIGAGVVGNAGIKNITITKYLKGILVLDLKSLKLKHISKEKIIFYYRDSSIKEMLILRLTFYKKIDTKAIKFYNCLKDYRKNQPNERSLGSTFKNNPQVKAGYLIDKLGLKGLQYKNLAVSSCHANFIIAKAESSAFDLYLMILLIKIIVYLKSGIKLDPEIKGLKLYQKNKKKDI